MQNQPAPFLFEAGKRAVVLLHTFAGSTTDVRVLGRQFQKAGYTVLAPLFTGHGTPDPTTIFTVGNPNQWWQDTTQAIDQLVKSGHPQVLIFGESLGGLFAIKALEERPEVLAGGTISTPLYPVDTSRVAARFLSDARSWYHKQALIPTDLAAKMTILTRAITPMLDRIAAYTVPIQAHLATIRKPVFIGQSGADELIDPTVGQRLADELAHHTQVVYRHYPGAPHVMTYSSQERDLAQDMIAFSNRFF
ncbi:alpha/beta hydrolase [Secundilactobacillus kimchicus]|uniref:alpha/beta hydrolase n=1 Tax=Secundilactobacillus kimchicus TaxID=528209 RepID=UPI0024A973AE|nr:alpha/beta fold hydrolase [Secundilactobacillus kimchicus]